MVRLYCQIIVPIENIFVFIYSLNIIQIPETFVNLDSDLSFYRHIAETSLIGHYQYKKSSLNYNLKCK